MSSSVTIPRDTGIFQLPDPFSLAHGGDLAGAQLAFDCFGPVDAPVVLVLGGISSGRHLTSSANRPQRGWWQQFVCSAGPIDLDRYRVIGIDFLGGPGASTSAANSEYREGGFPSIDTRDQARALELLLQELGIESLRALVGSSYGGMVGLALAASKAIPIEQLLLIAAAHESHPMATAWRSLQRDIVRQGVAAGNPKPALALARGLAMTTYRTADEFAQRFHQEPSFDSAICRFPVEDYLAARGRDFAEQFSPEVFVCLSESIDLHRIDPAQITSSVTIVAIESDQLVPVWQCEKLAAGLSGPVQLIRVVSEFGHDAFLKEFDQLSPVIRASLAGEEVLS